MPIIITFRIKDENLLKLNEKCRIRGDQSMIINKALENYFLSDLKEVDLNYS